MKNYRQIILAAIEDRKDVTPADEKEAVKEYGDVKFADPVNKKYPIDTEEHIRAAWSYINQEKNASKYDSSEVKTIKDRIISAWKEKIDSAGPPSADKKASYRKKIMAKVRENS